LIFDVDFSLHTIFNFSEEIDSTTKCLNAKHGQEQWNSTAKIVEALNKAKNYESNNPFFTAVMIHSYVNQYMVSL